MLERLHWRRRPDSDLIPPHNGEGPDEPADAAAQEMAAEDAAAEDAAAGAGAAAAREDAAAGAGAAEDTAAEDTAAEDTTAVPAPERSQPAPPGASVAPVVVPRWIQLVLLPIGLLGLWALARAAGTVLLILVAASTVALILNPLVKMIERRGVPRGLSILIVYLSGFAILGGVGVLLSNTVSTQVSHLQKDVPQLVNQANKDLVNLQNWLNSHGIKVHIQQQGQTALESLQKTILKRSSAIVSFSRDLLTQFVTISFDLVLVLVLSIYLLVYGREIGELVRRIMPPGDGTPEDDFQLLVQHAVFGYVRGQLLFSFIMGASAALSLWLFGILGIFPDGQHYALFFGGFYGLMEFIPYIGPIIGPLPAILVALFNNPISAVWVLVLFVALQQLEGHIVAPQVFRLSLRINPILIILGLLIGYQLYGIAGSLVALPVAAVIRETVIYLRRHLVLEPWPVSTSPNVLGPPREPPDSAE
jgi:predicted PurR-regulated permease PerM